MVNLLDKKVRGLEVQPEGQIWRGPSLGARVLATGKHETGKWVPTALQGEVFQSLGTARCSKAGWDSCGQRWVKMGSPWGDIFPEVRHEWIRQPGIPAWVQFF